MTIPACPHLRQLAYERFDEDWDLVARDPDVILRRQAHYMGPAVAQAIIDEIDTVLAQNFSNDQLEEWWYYDLRSGFDPVHVQMDFATWLRHIADVLRDALKAPPPAP